MGPVIFRTAFIDRAVIKQALMDKEAKRKLCFIRKKGIAKAEKIKIPMLPNTVIFIKNKITSIRKFFIGLKYAP